MRSLQSDVQVVRCKNYEALAKEAVQRILAYSKATISDKGKFSIALSGGFTLRGICALMTSADFRSEFDWTNIHFFWTHENFVPVTDPRSHYGMVADVLLTKVDIPIENIHPIKTNAQNAESAATSYEESIRNHFQTQGREIPSMDLILLTLGKDGHLASLYPKHPALNEEKRWTAPLCLEELEESHITMTPPLINQASQLMIFASGLDRAQALQEALDPALKDPTVPARKMHPTHGNITWIVDASAASQLEKKGI